MACSYVDGVFLEAHDHSPPSDEEWDALLEKLPRFAEEARRTGSLPRGALIVSDGGAPNPRQRKELARVTWATGLAGLPKAVVTSSALVRGVVTALNWLGSETRAFAPHELPHALEHLGVPEGHRPGLLLEITKLRAELSPPAGRSCREPSRRGAR